MTRLLTLEQNTALKILTLPEVNYNKETGVISVHPQNRRAFAVRTLTVSASFAIFEKQLLLILQIMKKTCHLQLLLWKLFKYECFWVLLHSYLVQKCSTLTTFKNADVRHFLFSEESINKMKSQCRKNSVTKKYLIWRIVMMIFYYTFCKR